MGISLYLCRRFAEQSMKSVRSILMVVCALWLLISCGHDKGQMLQQLEELEQMNRADSVMRNDSLAEDLVAYFDKHGTPNERMRARYILGRTYFDLGELPRSLETYLDAAGCADTTAADCDYKTLSRIHGQKAFIFKMQYLPQESADEFDNAINYSLKTGDSIVALVYMENKLITYYQQREYDSLLYYTDKVFHDYVKHGCFEYAANSLGASILVLLDRHDLPKARQYIDFYEKYSNSQTDPVNKLAASYAYKGTYHLNSGHSDSAVYYFEKQLKFKDLINNRVQGYHGLFKAYQQMNQKDSMAKYAELYSSANDSSNIFESADRLQRMQSIYKFERSQKEAKLNKEKAQRNKQLIWWTIGSGLSLLIVVVLCYRRILSKDRDKMKTLNQEYNNIRESFEKARKDIALIENEKENYIHLKEKELDYYKEKLRKFESFSRDADEQRKELCENPLLERLHKLASAGKRLSDVDMENVFGLIELSFPMFFEELDKLSSGMSYKQKSLCSLTKLNFIPSEIGSLLNMNYQSVTNMRSRLAKRLFGENCQIIDFDKKIHSIC